MSLLAHRPTTLALLVLSLFYFLGLGLALVWLRMKPETILAMTGGAILLVVMFLRPFIGVQVFLVLLFFENAIATQEGLTAMKGLGAITLVGWLGSLMLQRRVNVQANALLLAMLAYLAWTGLCVTTAINTSVAITQFMSNAALFLGAVMFSSVVDRPRRLLAVQMGVVACTTFATLAAILMYYAGMTRVAVGFVGNRNLLALYINLAAAFALLIYPAVASGLARGALILSLAVLFPGMALTLSRTGFVVLCVSIVAVWYRLAREKVLLILLTSATMITAVLFILPSEFWQRAESILPSIEHREDTLGIRLKIWEAGLDMIADHPITGIGPANFSGASRKYGRGGTVPRGLSAHSVYVGVAAESGLVGLGLFLGTIGLAVYYARRCFRVARDAGDQVLSRGALSIETALLILMAHGLTGSVEGLKVLWMMIGLSLALRYLSRPLESKHGAPARVTGSSVPETAPA